MAYTQKIGTMKIYVNDYGQTIINEIRKEIYNEFAKLFKSEYENSEYKKALYFDLTYTENGDFIITLKINILYSGVYQTILNYSFIHPFLLNIIEEFKNIKITTNNFSTLITVMASDIVSINNLKKIIEKSEAYLIRESNNGKFSLFQTEDEVISQVSKTIKDNFYFLNCHRKTKFHEIDPKVIEARLCIAYGLYNASITMIIIALEETLKTILKYDYFNKYLQLDKERSLEEIKALTQKAQKKFGSLPLSKCISNALNNNLITGDEESLLKNINEKLRSAHFHSDKSKMFSNDKTEVTFFNNSAGPIKKVESKNMSPNDLIFIQGYLQYFLAEKNAKYIFNEIEDLVFTITTRYRQKNKKFIEKVETT